MALAPQNGFFYDQLPLLLVPQTRMEMILIAAASQIAYYFANTTPLFGSDVPAWSAQFFPYMVVGMYLPALVLVLRRPNEGAAPAWLERLAQSSHKQRRLKLRTSAAVACAMAAPCTACNFSNVRAVPLLREVRWSVV
jgi:hypothetical protein